MTTETLPPEVRDYFARQGERSAEVRKAAIRAEVDTEYPDLPDETRALLARERFVTTMRIRGGMRRKNLTAKKAAA